MLRLPSSGKEFATVSETVRNWLVAFATIAAALLVGGAIDAILVGVLSREAGPAHRVRASIARALRGQPEIWSVLLAISIFRPFDFAHSRSLLWIDRLTVALAVLSVTLFLARLAGWLIRAYLSKDSVAAPGGSIFVNLARLLIWAVGLTFMLGALGVQIGPLVASLGVVGLAVSLGLQDTLANFFGGLQITTSRQIQPGQYIRLSTGEEGTVIDVTWRNTTLCAPSNDLVIVPNSVIGRAQITNFTAESEQHAVTTAFTVAFGSDLEAVKRIALEVARAVRDESDAAVPDAEPIVRFRGFGSEGVTVALTLHVVRYQARLPVVSELVENLHARLIAAEIAFAPADAVPVPAPRPPAPPAPPLPGIKPR
jgi:small-conductance mechanosensitive channel